MVYFSATGNTQAVAQTIADSLNADLYEIVPEDPYTEEDLDWNVADSRVNVEHEDPDFRPAIAGGVPDLSGYDTVFIGYPLWWRQAPNIVWNFVESSDLAGKTVIPFCTSMSDGIGTSEKPWRPWPPMPPGWPANALGKAWTRPASSSGWRAWGFPPPNSSFPSQHHSHEWGPSQQARAPFFAVERGRIQGKRTGGIFSLLSAFVPIMAGIPVLETGWKRGGQP